VNSTMVPGPLVAIVETILTPPISVSWMDK